jgi:hypothetical protein
VDFKNKTIIIWTNETDEIDNILQRLRKQGAKVVMASFPDLSESAIFIDDRVYAIEQIKVLLGEK